MTPRQLFDQLTAKTKLALAKRDSKVCDEVFGYDRRSYPATTINAVYALCERYAQRNK